MAAKIYLKNRITECYIHRLKILAISQICLAQFATYYYKTFIVDYDYQPSQLSNNSAFHFIHSTLNKNKKL